jgi:hypothetical protein
MIYGFKEWINKATLRIPPVEEVAQEFYDDMGRNHPGCDLGIAGSSEENPGSGNCAWTAKTFLIWAKTKPNILQHTKVVSFPTNHDEIKNPKGAKIGHIVPVYNGYIIDYIKTFTYGKQHELVPVRNLNPGLHNLKDGGPEFYNSYKTYGYDSYIVGNTWEETERFMGEYYKTKNLRIKTFDPPRKSGREYEDWQLGKWGGNFPDYSFRNQGVQRGT